LTASIWPALKILLLPFPPQVLVTPRKHLASPPPTPLLSCRRPSSAPLGIVLLPRARHHPPSARWRLMRANSRAGIPSSRGLDCPLTWPLNGHSSKNSPRCCSDSLPSRQFQGSGSSHDSAHLARLNGAGGADRLRLIFRCSPVGVSAGPTRRGLKLRLLGHARLSAAVDRVPMMEVAATGAFRDPGRRQGSARQGD